MFTGIIEHIGEIEEIKKKESGVTWLIGPTPFFEGALALGESIAVAGTCLTVSHITDEKFWVDISAESLARTCLGEKEPGDQVNLERALRVGDRMGGHFVTGHVDGVGTITKLKPDGEFMLVEVKLKPEAAPFMAPKGSVTINGVSLTVNEVRDLGDEGVTIGMTWIPLTLKSTTFKNFTRGQKVNVEFDVVARYIAQAVKSYGKN